MEFTITFGEKRVTNLSSIRCYFLGITATGRTMSLKDMPNLKLKWKRQAPIDAVEGREMQMCYETTAAGKTIIEMTCTSSNFGRASNKQVVKIELIEKAELLVIHGSTHFGSFEGRGKLVNKKVPADIIVITAAPATDQSEAADHGLLW